MFSEMIHILKDGLCPPEVELRRRLEAAIIKKGGILQQPKPCWSGDTKINPNVFHMFWASILIEDYESMGTVVGMIEFELSSESKRQDLMEVLGESLAKLGSLPGDYDTVWLTEKINAAAKRIGLKR